VVPLEGAPEAVEAPKEERAVARAIEVLTERRFDRNRTASTVVTG
jgi:hypothetical protein